MGIGALYSATATSICLSHALRPATTTHEMAPAESGHTTHGIDSEGTAA